MVRGHDHLDRARCDRCPHSGAASGVVVDQPPDLGAIDEVTVELGMLQDGLLFDLACGRGGYGIEVARRTGARLIGVDFSGVALEQARSSSAWLLSAGRAEFQVGTLLATGLPTGAADGAMCVDAVQFAEPPLGALIEFRRVLAPGGWLVLSSWEAADPSDERVSPRIHAVNLRRDLPAAGFVDVQVHEKPEWREVERAMWEAVSYTHLTLPTNREV